MAGKPLPNPGDVVNGHRYVGAAGSRADANDPLKWQPLTGAEAQTWLDQHDPNTAGMVRSILAGKAPMPVINTAGRNPSPGVVNLMNWVRRVDPNVDAQDYPATLSARRGWNNGGVQSQSVTSARQLIRHLADLASQGETLPAMGPNSDPNGLAQSVMAGVSGALAPLPVHMSVFGHDIGSAAWARRGADMTGNAGAYRAVAQDTQNVATEISKLFKNAAPGEAETAQRQASMSPDASPNERRATTISLARALRDRIQAGTEQYRQQMGAAADPSWSMIGPEEDQMLRQLEQYGYVKGSGRRAAPSRPAPQNAMAPQAPTAPARQGRPSLSEIFGR